MAWSFVGIGTVATPVTSGNYTLTEPAGVAQYDLLVACIAYRGSAAFTLPAGWNVVATQQSTGDTDATDGIASGVMAYIVRGASAPALQFTRTAGDVAMGRIVAYRGNATSSVYDTGTANTLGAVNVTVTTGTFSTAQANELIVCMGAGGDNYTWSAFDAATDPTAASGATDTTTAPTAGTWIERGDSGTNTGADTSLAIADAIRATAGATGTIQATASGAGRSVLIAGAFKISPNVTVALTGEAVTATPNDLDNATAKALTGEGGTAAAGTLTPAPSKELSGETATGSAGTTSPESGAGLGGEAATASDGTAAPELSIGLSGASATVSAGTIEASGPADPAGYRPIGYGLGAYGLVTYGGVTGGAASPDVTVALSGVGATASAGTIAAASDVPASGEAGSVSSGSLAAFIAAVLGGDAVAVSAGDVEVEGVVAADPGDYIVMARRRGRR